MRNAIQIADDDQIELGPKMRALANDKQRRFVCALFDAPRTNGRITWAAKAAGYGTDTSSRKSLAALGSRLCQDPDIQAAIAELSQKRLRLLSPTALCSLEKLINSPEHKDHARGLAMVLDRSDPIATEHHVIVDDNRAPSIEITQKVLDRIEELMRLAGLSPKAPAVIDGDFKVIGNG